MTQVTKDDLKKTEENIVKSLADSLAPVKDDINIMKLSLYGRDSRAGLVGDVNNLKNSGNWIKWLAGGGFLTGLSGWFKDLIK